MPGKYDVAIVGGGIAGLTAAVELEKFNLKVLILEKTDRVGGRVKTDIVDDFRLDHGFQVYMDQYPEGKLMLDYEALDLKTFDNGALCFNDYKKFELNDTSRNKLAIGRMAFSPVGTVMDKIRLSNLRARLKNASIEQIFQRPSHTTLDYLKQLGYSDRIISRFFKPFFSGIFLEHKLQTSSRMFEFVFKMLSEGEATVPARGMEEIPKQMKAQLQRTEFRFHTEVDLVNSHAITTKNGETIECGTIILAANADGLVPNLHSHMDWQQTATYYFSTEKNVLNKKLIAINYHTGKLVNNFAVMSDISPDYAPQGRHLISVSLTHIPNESVEEVSQHIKNELSIAFGPSVSQWKFLKNYHIDQALPFPKDFKAEIPFSETRIKDGLYLAGDYLLHGSINAAMKSGRLAAQAAVLDFNTSTVDN